MTHEPDIQNYAQRVSARLRELRRDRGLTVDELRGQLTKLSGEEVNRTTYYCWERGAAHGGSDVPLRMLPAIAKAFGYATPTGWLPSDGE